MFRNITQIVLIAAMLVVLTSCDKKGRPEKVVSQYFSALEKGDVETAWGLLYDKDLVISSSDGGKFSFMARPDLDTYKRQTLELPRIEVTDIERKDELCREGELEVFMVTARTAERDRNVERMSAQFLSYLAPNSEGQWSVLLPRPIAESRPADTTTVIE